MSGLVGWAYSWRLQKSNGNVVKSSWRGPGSEKCRQRGVLNIETKDSYPCHID